MACAGPSYGTATVSYWRGTGMLSQEELRLREYLPPRSTTPPGPLSKKQKMLRKNTTPWESTFGLVMQDGGRGRPLPSPPRKKKPVAEEKPFPPRPKTMKQLLAEKNTYPNVSHFGIPQELVNGGHNKDDPPPAGIYRVTGSARNVSEWYP